MPLPAMPVCVTIAGSDSGGGAGIQADLRTFQWFQTYGTSVVTAVTAQNPHAVHAVHRLPAALVVAQWRAVRAAYDLAAIKTGMLGDATLVQAVAAELRGSRVPLVVDPVLLATRGARLLADDAVAVLVAELLPLATLLTPNLPEAERLTGAALRDAAACRTAARRLAARGPAVLLKGGHLGAAGSTDWLATGDALYELTAPPLAAPPATHGTGCTLSAAVAAQLAHGRPLLDAVVAAKAFVWGALRQPRHLGLGTAGLYPPAALEPQVVTVTRC